jgi:Ca2+-binding EF-hand superfamily protein
MPFYFASLRGPIMKKLGWLTSQPLVAACIITAACTFAAKASAQDRRDGDRGERRSFDFSAIIKGWDKNGNGLVEPSELDDRSKRFAESMARRAGLDASQPIPVDKLLSASQMPRDGGSSSDSSNNSSSDSSSDRERERSDSDRERDRDRDREKERERDRERSSNSSSKTPTPAVPGFGAVATAPKAAGFDVPLSVDTTIPLEKRYDTRVIEYVDKMLRDYDKNRDGSVDNIEWKEGRWSTPPEESDTNKDNKLSKAELCERIARRFGLQNSTPGSGSSSGSSGGSSSSSSSSPSSSGGEFAKFKDYATSLIKQHDRNKNGVLEKDEWGDLKSEHRAADANNDSVITVDELALKLQAYSTSTASSSGSSSSSSSGSRGGDSKGGESKRSGWGWGSKSGSSSTAAKPGYKKDYRFQTAAERLPKGLPDWFLRQDADADGQVAMVEYATSWTDSTAAEFQKYDLDGDGFITPNECLASMTPVKK